MTERKFTQASLTAQNTFGDSLQIDAGDRFTVSLSGTFSATVTLQRRFDGVNWRNVETYTDETEKDGLAAEGQLIRLGIETGDYVSGTALVRIGKG